jgi:hypothetical protein
MTASDNCRVDECERLAAGSVAGNDLPGQLRLCATHMEDFRLNGAGWTVDWARDASEPTSVIVPVVNSVGTSVGFSGPRAQRSTESDQVTGDSGVKSFWQSPGRAMRRMRARGASNRKNRP